MGTFRYLYIDMNAFYASCEQLADPALRGRPVGITAIESGSSAIIAASYEAKARGVKNVMRMAEVRALCPDIILRQCRHLYYRRINQRIASEIDKIAELERVRSIDEFQVILGGQTSSLEGAMRLARQIKYVIRTKVGAELRCSIGIGPSELLAKIAGKLEKPDGLQWLSPDNLPNRIEHLSLDDLPGISKRMMARLNNAGVMTMRDLYALDPRHARAIWHSVQGERFVRALQGMDVPLLNTERGGYGNSKMLAPEYRSPEQARLVGRWLVEKASSRLRRDGYCTRAIHVGVRFWKQGDGRKRKITATQDTREILAVYETLWEQMRPRQKLYLISIHLGDVIPLDNRSGELFLPLAPGTRNISEKLSVAIDALNQRYPPKADGTRIISFGKQQPHPGFFERE